MIALRPSHWSGTAPCYDPVAIIHGRSMIATTASHLMIEKAVVCSWPRSTTSSSSTSNLSSSVTIDVRPLRPCELWDGPAEREISGMSKQPSARGVQFAKGCSTPLSFASKTRFSCASTWAVCTGAVEEATHRRTLSLALKCCHGTRNVLLRRICVLQRVPALAGPLRWVHVIRDSLRHNDDACLGVMQTLSRGQCMAFLSHNECGGCSGWLVVTLAWFHLQVIAREGRHPTILDSWYAEAHESNLWNMSQDWQRGTVGRSCAPHILPSFLFAFAMDGARLSSPEVCATKGFLSGLIIGFAFSATLYGITIMQAYVYYRRYLQDGAALKLFVAFLIVLDTLTTAFAAHGLHTYVVDDYLQPSKVNTIVWSLITENYLCILTAVLVQFYFAQRLWILSRRNIALTGMIAVLALVSLGTGTWVGAEMSNTLIDKLMVYAIQRGLVTTIGQLFDFVTIIAAPTSFLYLPVILMQSKLYTNLLLATLNVRSYLHTQAIGGGSVIEVESGSLVFTRATTTGIVQDSHRARSFALTSRDAALPPITFDAKSPNLAEEVQYAPVALGIHVAALLMDNM
ncbi:hypothetical protein NUW54_g5301 [Trametes sanguinea]|uniref:Uncharacterized protein n=1 Tax=Trametes sanguinea TaxID=158606 RepID=A0ACC1PWI5_9APHY|nr:hypothetical protein NUW54_g5301 [Trametes sanguinea]